MKRELRELLAELAGIWLVTLAIATFQDSDQLTSTTLGVAGAGSIVCLIRYFKSRGKDKTIYMPGEKP